MSDRLPSSPIEALAREIRARAEPVQAVLCGFDLWLELMGSGLVSGRDMLPGARFAGGEEGPQALKVPVPVIGGRIVVSLDPSLPPNGHELRP